LRQRQNGTKDKAKIAKNFVLGQDKTKVIKSFCPWDKTRQNPRKVLSQDKRKTRQKLEIGTKFIISQVIPKDLSREYKLP